MSHAIEKTEQPAVLSLRNIVFWSFLLLVFSLSFTKPFFDIANQPLAVTDIIFPFVTILWIVSFIAGISRIKWTRFYWLLAFYFLAMLLSAFLSVNPAQSFVKLLGEAYLLGLAVLAINLVRTADDFRKVILTSLAGTILAAVIGLFALAIFYVKPDSPVLEWITYPYGAVPVGNYPRLSSTFVSASMFCNYLNVSLLMTLMAGKAGWIRSPLIWILLSVIFVCSIFTISAGLGGILLSLAIWVWMLYRTQQKVPARLCLTAGVVIAGLFYLMTFVALSPYPGAPYTLNVPVLSITLLPSPRVLVWFEAFKTFSEHIITGKGLGQSVANVLFQNTDGSYSLLTDAHNIFLSVAAQSGILALIAIVLICIYVTRMAFRKPFDGSLKALLLCGLGIAFLASFIYQGLTGAFEDARHLWLLTGLIIAAASLPEAKKT